MKKPFIFLSFVIFSFFFVNNQDPERRMLRAEEVVEEVAIEQDSAPKTYRWTDKVGRGFMNSTLAIAEFPAEIRQASTEGNVLTKPLKGSTVGIAKGLWHTGERFFHGGVELLTFPFNYPDAKKAPLVEPAYMWKRNGFVLEHQGG